MQNPSHIRVDVSGIAIYVRTKEEAAHLTSVGHQLAKFKLALHKIKNKYPCATVEDMSRVAKESLGE